MRTFVVAIISAIAFQGQAVWLMDGDKTEEENTSLKQLGEDIESGDCNTTTIDLPEGEDGCSVALNVDAEEGTLTVATSKEDASDCGCKGGDDADSEDESAAESDDE